MNKQPDSNGEIIGITIALFVALSIATAGMYYLSKNGMFDLEQTGFPHIALFRLFVRGEIYAWAGFVFVPVGWLVFLILFVRCFIIDRKIIATTKGCDAK